MVLPLRVFEDRYRLMIDCYLEEEHPFAVVLIREGREVGGQAVPCEAGTTAAIAAATRLTDGRMNITTVGSERFRLWDVWHDLPYLVGSAEPWSLTDAGLDRAWKRTGSVRVPFQKYQSLLDQPTVVEMLLVEQTAMRREHLLLEHIFRTQTG